MAASTSSAPAAGSVDKPAGEVEDTSADAGSGDFNFTEFDKELGEDISETDEDDLGEGKPAAAQPPATPAAKPTPPADKPPATGTAPAKPAEAPPVAAAPVAPPAAPAKEGQPPAPAAPAAVDQPPKAPTDEERKAAYTKWRTDSEARLTEYYKLREEDADKVLSSPAEVLPKLAAQVHLDVYEATVNDLHSRMPGIVAQIVHQLNATQKYEEQFFSAFPKLREHNEAVARFATAFRQLNPKTPPDQFMRQVGMAMMASLGIPFEDAGQPAAAPTPAGNAGGAAPGPTVVARDILQPGGGFVPAPSGGVAPAPPSAKDINPWAAMAEDLMREDS